MEINDAFNTSAKSVFNTFTTNNGVASYRIPLYQREYNWEKENVERLFQDIIYGLNHLSKDKNSFAYIGTIILIDDQKNKESQFHGYSFDVVDGQQRLTTLSLSCVVIHSIVHEILSDISEMEGEIFDWLRIELDELKNQLLFCLVGVQAAFQVDYDTAYPRLIKQDQDIRSSIKNQSNYKSNISQILLSYLDHIRQKNTTRFEIDFSTQSQTELNNIINIKNIIEDYLHGNIFEKEESDYFDSEDMNIPFDLINNENTRKNLFKQLSDENIYSFKEILKETSDKNIAIAMNVIRISRFFLDRVIITRVETKYEDFAFEIFDSLNSTGQPLSALETFKPLVYKDAHSNSDRKNEELLEIFKEIENYIHDFKAKDREVIIKEVIITFALYLKGKKISGKLDEQRNFLRNSYQEAKNQNHKINYLKYLKEVVDFRENFWDKNNIIHQLRNLQEEREEILTCIYFILDMKTTLAIPILLRYYSESIKTSDFRDFASAVKALTAFIVLRRSATGGTNGIDSDLRYLMSHGMKPNKKSEARPGSISLKLDSLSEEKDLLEIRSFKKYLKDYLNSNLRINNKESWKSQFVNLSIYDRAPQALIRFLIFLAMNNSDINLDQNIIYKESRRSDARNYLNLQRWTDNNYKTIEHIAPSQPRKDSDWDAKIYTNPNLKHTIGNLILLPEKENSNIGNRPWSEKKIFYSLFASENVDSISTIIQHAKSFGINIGKNTRILLENGKCLPILKTISRKEIWDHDIIIQRSENIANLVWEEIKSWLDYEN